MDIVKVLNTCQKITIYGENSLKETEVLQSALDEVISEKELLILAPTLDSRLVKLNSKDTYSIIFFCQNSPFSCKMKVTKYLTKENLTVAKIKLLEPLTKVQRRESYRLDCTNVDIEFDLLTEELENKLFKSTAEILEDDVVKFSCNGIVKDISSGGIKFNSNTELSENDIIVLSFTINKNDILTKGKIIFSEELNFEKHKFSYKMCFVDLPKMTKDFLDKYIFKEQVKRAKKQNGVD